MTTTPRLRLLTRADCHLCEVAARDLADLGVAFEEVDMDSEPALEERYGDAIPVLLIGERELARAPIWPAMLRAALAEAGIAPDVQRVRWV